MKVGLDVRIPLIRVLSAGGGEKLPPNVLSSPLPKNKFFLKKNT